MPRDCEPVRRRLREAALELYLANGYNRTTASEIAGRAGVTERTFFRHFPDKREVLFDGEDALSTILVSAVQRAPKELAPGATLFRAFLEAEPLLQENRDLAGLRRDVILSSPALQERELTKTMTLAALVAAELVKRGTPEEVASLLAQVGMIAFGHAFVAWLSDPRADLREHLTSAFNEVRQLST